MALFFKIIDNEVEEIKIVQLEQTDLMFAFNELYDTIDEYINKNNTQISKRKVNKSLVLVKKIGLEYVVNFILDKAKEYVIELPHIHLISKP